MTFTEIQSLQSGLDNLNRKVDTLIAALLGDDQFGEGRIPSLERRVGDHEARIGELEEAKDIEQAKSGLSLSWRQKIVALVIGLPAFVHYTLQVLRDLQVIR